MWQGVLKGGILQNKRDLCVWVRLREGLPLPVPMASGPLIRGAVCLLDRAQVFHNTPEKHTCRETVL